MIFSFTESFHFLAHKRHFSFAVAAEVLFSVYAGFIGMLLLVNTRNVMEYAGFNPGDLMLIMVVPGLALAAGVLAAARISKKRLELGIVPFGALGMAIFPLFFAGSFKYSFNYLNHTIFPLLLLWTFLAGFSAGMFLAPVRQYLQQSALPAYRGRLIAHGNCVFTLSAIAAVLAAYVMAVFLRVDTWVLYGAMSLAVAAVSLTIFLRRPEFLFRMMIIVFRNTIYRLKIEGEEKIPESGPAIIIANHVSFIDGFFITACTSRRVHFMMHEDFYRYPLLHPFVKWAGFIEVPSPQKVKQMQRMFAKVQRMLSRGRIVCVFPEGSITRNGIMQGFKSGIDRMIPSGVEVPVIPVRLGMVWGSLLTLFNGRLKFVPPHEVPIPASVTVGDPIDPDLTSYEIRQIISEMGAESEMAVRENEYPLHYHFARRAKRHPFQKTFKDFEGNELSNFSVLVRAILLSRAIRRMVPEETRYVGVMLPNSTAAVVTMLAVMMADKTPAVLNFTVSRAATEAAIAKAGLDCILTSRRFVEKLQLTPFPQMVMLEDVALQINRRRKFWTAVAAALLPSRELMNFVAPATYDDVFCNAAVIFSSGSSGDPKGVMLTHHNFNSDFFSFWRVIGWRKTDKVVGNLPMFHSFGLMVSFWFPAMSGTEVILLPNPLDSSAVLRLVPNYKATLMMATPTFLQSYMRRCTENQFASLRLVITGAEKLRTDIAERFKDMTGLSVIEGYGCTELSPIVSINLSNSMFTLGVQAGKLGSIGVPLPGICVRIVDPVTGLMQPESTDGLIMVKAATVMKGYLNDPHLTAEVIKHGWYNTGDIGRMDGDGYMTITGRMSRFSKIGGEMVPHELVEVAINEILESEERCIAVTGVEDARKGEKLIVLYSLPELNPAVIIEQLRARGLANLWIPKAEDFRRVEKIPLLGSGKIDLQKVRELAAAVSQVS